MDRLDFSAERNATRASTAALRLESEVTGQVHDALPLSQCSVCFGNTRTARENQVRRRAERDSESHSTGNLWVKSMVGFGKNQLEALQSKLVTVLQTDRAGKS